MTPARGSCVVITSCENWTAAFIGDSPYLLNLRREIRQGNPMIPLPISVPVGRMASGKTRLYKIPLIGRFFSSRHLLVAAIGLSECHRLQQGAKAHRQRPSPSTRQWTWRMGDRSCSSRSHRRGGWDRLGAQLREEARKDLRETKRTEE